MSVNAKFETKRKIGEKQQKSVCIVSGKAVRDTASTQRVHQSARQPRRTRERMNGKSLRECYTIARAVETRVNPTEDDTGLRITATL